MIESEPPLQVFTKDHKKTTHVLLLLCDKTRKAGMKKGKEEKSMFGNNAFTQFQSQPAEDLAVSQKAPQNWEDKGKN